MKEARLPLLDVTDRRIIAELVADGRMSNATLARRVGIAQSTCINRVRLLRDSGVIAGFGAELDLTKIGRPIQALIQVQLRRNSRREARDFHDYAVTLPGLITAFFVAGVDDFLLHVAVPTTDALRDLVSERVASHPAVSKTETQLVFEASRGRPLPAVKDSDSPGAPVTRPRTTTG